MHFDEFDVRIVELCKVLFMCDMNCMFIAECTVHMRHAKYTQSMDFAEFDVRDAELCKVLFMSDMDFPLKSYVS